MKSHDEEPTPLRRAELASSAMIKRALPQAVRRGNPLRKFGITRRLPTELVGYQLRGRQFSKSENVHMMRMKSGYCYDNCDD